MSDRTSVDAMADQNAIQFSEISSIKDLRSACEAIISDAHTQIRRIAYRTDAEANELRITYKSRIDLASNLLARAE